MARPKETARLTHGPPASANSPWAPRQRPHTSSFPIRLTWAAPPRGICKRQVCNYSKANRERALADPAPTQVQQVTSGGDRQRSRPKRRAAPRHPQVWAAHRSTASIWRKSRVRPECPINARKSTPPDNIFRVYPFYFEWTRAGLDKRKIYIQIKNTRLLAYWRRLWIRKFGIFFSVLLPGLRLGACDCFIRTHIRLDVQELAYLHYPGTWNGFGGS